MSTNKEDRPILNIELTLTDKLLEIFGWLILISLWMMTLLIFSKFPDIIPIHYNFEGQPDNYGNKATIFLFPILSTLLFVGMTILNKFPHIFNYPIKITHQNAERQYTIATRLIRYLKFIIVVSFAIIAFMTSQTANGRISGLGIWFLPLFIGLIYIPMIFAIVKLFKTT